MDIQSTTNEIGGNVGPEIGECQEEIRFQGEDLVDVRGREGAHPRLLAARLRWAHDIAGGADDAVLLAEQIQRFAGLFGEADNFGLAGTLSTPAYQVFDISPKCVRERSPRAASRARASKARIPPSP